MDTQTSIAVIVAPAGGRVRSGRATLVGGAQRFERVAGGYVCYVAAEAVPEHLEYDPDEVR